MNSTKTRMLDELHFLRTMQERQQLQHQANAPAPEQPSVSPRGRFLAFLLTTLLGIGILQQCEQADVAAYTTLAK